MLDRRRVQDRLVTVEPKWPVWPPATLAGHSDAQLELMYALAAELTVPRVLYAGSHCAANLFRACRCRERRSMGSAHSWYMRHSTRVMLAHNWAQGALY